jgi:HEPN domain-containing protein
MPPDEKAVGLAAKWWRLAQDDLRYAERGLDIAFACGFHCQQAAEKAVKALLVFHQIDFPHTHDLEELLELLPGSEVRPIDWTREASEFLTRFAVETRYPPGEATTAEAAHALALSRAILEGVRRQLPQAVTQGHGAPPSAEAPGGTRDGL